jgi:23S rRNA (adenine2503-C2)-methyltransferase
MTAVSAHAPQPPAETGLAASLTEVERQRILKSALFARRPACCRTDGATWSACRVRTDRCAGRDRRETLPHQADLALALSSGRDGFRADEFDRQAVAGQAGRTLRHRAGSHHGPDLERRDPQFLFRFRDGQEAETVYIPDRREDRGAVCISSQVGCTLSCTFCHTGTQKLVRNLGAAEIVGQFMAARDSYGRMAQPQGARPRACSPTIVLMGDGRAAV